MSENIRALQCVTCHSIEVLPVYFGPPENDELLSYVVEKHKFPDGSAHFGNLIHHINVDLADGTGERPATMDDWNNEKFRELITKDIQEKATKPGSGTGLGQEYYDTKDTFREDANACWKARLQPDRCNDYGSESKRLVPKTAADRKELGLGKPRSNRTLCEFCVMHAHMVQPVIFNKRGLYN